ncbi:MAG: 2OG-Fe(II) oxygenase [Deltaproteobacteria bacterium]|nr:2OG-Fe(II) oxygenase [Deltaproteobacteria bacterium]
MAALFAESQFDRGEHPNDPLASMLSNERAQSLPFVGPLGRLIDQHAKQFGMKNAGHEYFAGYLARTRFDDVASLHHDNTCCQNCLSVLYYANATWEPSWGGETLFFDESGDAACSVSPKPGRIAIFNSFLLHRGGIPMRNAPVERFVVAIFYYCQEGLQKIASRGT